MLMKATEIIIENLKTLTLLEASDLVKQIEETFNIDASINFNSSSEGVIGKGAGDDKNSTNLTEEVDEQSEFSVVLEEVPADKKIPILKVVRSLTGLGLREAKMLVDSAPKSIKEKLAKDIAEDMINQLKNVGAKVSLV
uniref:Large ribosomal subunit protein bL12c n=1 Tax=Astrosyne radiata TaxID=1158023 RepID=A0A2U9NTD4_9STRA|nr:ribosomal protein L12 [Astrosyne radiata]AWT40295.1 ribosomal protein L12 [Astrosyne radiata]